MLGMLDYHPMSGANNVWSPWIKHTEDTLRGSVKEVALINYRRQQTVAAGKRFVVEARDIQTMIRAFEEKSLDHVQLKDKKYTLLPRAVGGSACLIGHNGSKYVVIATSLTMFLVLVLNDTCSKAGKRDTESIDNAIAFAKKLVARLATNGY